MRAAELLGAVLAGGESRRFGRDKTVEVIAGKTLMERAAETLARVFDPVVVVSSREPTTAEWPHVTDRRPGRGPLAGIEAALLHARGLGLGGAFVLACDLPLVDAQAVRDVLRAGGAAAACGPARKGHPSVEPLCAAYRVSCLPLVSGALDRGEGSVHELFASVGGVTAPIRRDVFLNVNRPEDAERAAAALEKGQVRITARRAPTPAGS